MTGLIPSAYFPKDISQLLLIFFVRMVDVLRCDFEKSKSVSQTLFNRNDKFKQNKNHFFKICLFLKVFSFRIFLSFLSVCSKILV